MQINKGISHPKARTEVSEAQCCQSISRKIIWRTGNENLDNKKISHSIQN